MDLIDIILRDFTPRGWCGPWEKGWAWVYGIANYLIFQAYILNAAFLLMGILQKKWQETFRSHIQLKWAEENQTKIIVVYALFILLCGIGHLLDGVISFFSAKYHLWAIWHCITAIVSCYSCYVTFKLRKVAATFIMAPALK